MSTLHSVEPEIDIECPVCGMNLYVCVEDIDDFDFGFANVYDEFVTCEECGCTFTQHVKVEFDMEVTDEGRSNICKVDEDGVDITVKSDKYTADLFEEQRKADTE